MYKKKERALKEERITLPHRRRTHSFSSSLLDTIYRSIDDEPALSKKQSNSVLPSRGRAQFLGEEDNNKKKNNDLTSMKSQHTASSSCSSRTGNVVTLQQQQSIKNQPKNEKDRCHQGLDFTRTKLRALMIYGELKKVKQPISPGGRIVSFLSSIFSPGRTATKKAKICSIGAMEDVSFENVIDKSTKSKSSSCSTSSFSRTCGHKCVHGGDPRLSSAPLIRKGSGKKHLRSINVQGFPSYLNYDGEEEDDDMSCSSSELFELDHHLIGIGNGRYNEELPVYETTSFKTNQVIANGFFV